jgi:hypothetical protein
MHHQQVIRQIQTKMHSNMYDVFDSQYSYQHVSAVIPAIFRVCSYYKNTIVTVTITQ